MTLALVALAMMELVHIPLTITPNQPSRYAPLLIKTIPEQSTKFQVLILGAGSDGKHIIRSSTQAFHSVEDRFISRRDVSQPDGRIADVDKAKPGRTAETGGLDRKKPALFIDHQTDGSSSFAGSESADSDAKARQYYAYAGQGCSQSTQFEAGSCDLITSGNSSHSLPLSTEVCIRVIGVVIASLLILGGLLFIPYSLVRTPVRSFWWENGSGIGGIVACVGFFLLFESFLG